MPRPCHSLAEARMLNPHTVSPTLASPPWLSSAQTMFCALTLIPHFVYLGRGTSEKRSKSHQSKCDLFYFIIFIYCVFMCVHGSVSGEGQRTASKSRLSPSAMWDPGIKRGCQAWWQAPLSIDLSHQPLSATS